MDIIPGMITGGYLFAAVSSCCCCSSSSHPILFSSCCCWPFGVRILQRRCSFLFAFHLFFCFFGVDSLKNWRICETRDCFPPLLIVSFSVLYRIIFLSNLFIILWRSPSFFSLSLFFFVFLRAAAKRVAGIINMARLCSALRFRDCSESLLPWFLTVSFFAIIER